MPTTNRHKVAFTEEEWAGLELTARALLPGLPESQMSESNMIRALCGLSPLANGGVRRGGSETGNKHYLRRKKKLKAENNS